MPDIREFIAEQREQITNEQKLAIKKFAEDMMKCFGREFWLKIYPELNNRMDKYLEEYTEIVNNANAEEQKAGIVLFDVWALAKVTDELEKEGKIKRIK